jgi:hypothetical protein
MIDIAQNRLKCYGSRVTYTLADLVNDEWEDNTSKPVHSILSTWALHDLGSPETINTVYERSYRALNNNGILINGDFIKPEDAVQEFEGGHIFVSKGLELLSNVDFVKAKTISLFEPESVNPTTAQKLRMYCGSKMNNAYNQALVRVNTKLRFVCTAQLQCYV